MCTCHDWDANDGLVFLKLTSMLFSFPHTLNSGIKLFSLGGHFKLYGLYVPGNFQVVGKLNY